MNKKLLSILSILFLFSLLVISCSTKDTTGTVASVVLMSIKIIILHNIVQQQMQMVQQYLLLQERSFSVDSLGNSSLTKISDNNYKSGSSDYQYFEFTDDTLTITKSDNSNKKTVQ